MKKAIFIAILAAASALFADETPPAYTCTLRVERPTATNKKQKSSKGSKQSKEVTNTTMSWPVKVSFSGKDIPKKSEIRAFFVGTRNGTPDIIGKSTTEVKLDDKNAFKADIVAPATQMTKTTKQSGGRRNRSTRSETTGDRITGCVIQLVVDDKVVRNWTSNTAWKKLAKEDVLDTEKLLKP